MLFFLYGEDSYLSRQKLRELKEKFLKEVDATGSSLTVVDGSTASYSEISNSINAPSLFARRRMVVIENIFANKSKAIVKELNEYLKNTKADNNIIVFWDEICEDKKNAKTKTALFLFLKKQKYAQCFNRMSNTETISWVKKKAESAGAKISHQAAVTFQSLIGNDLWSASNELEKLINFKIGRFIEEEDVRHFISGHFDSNIFLLTDSIGARNKALAVRLLEDEIESGLSESQILNMVTRQYRILLLIRSAIDQGHTSRKIMSTLKLPPFIVNKAVSQVRNYTLPALRNILNYLIRTDREMKSGQADIRTRLSLMIAKL
jgi:DNA polymerase-3 subunit delta